eukprot:m.69594 g.69594  ORF g.69594 m.69594 type:complete len:143 (+) comp12069_c0_seq1:1531-1959(+)
MEVIINNSVVSLCRHQKRGLAGQAALQTAIMSCFATDWRYALPVPKKGIIRGRLVKPYCLEQEHQKLLLRLSNWKTQQANQDTCFVRVKHLKTKGAPAFWFAEVCTGNNVRGSATDIAQRVAIGDALQLANELQTQGLFSGE